MGDLQGKFSNICLIFGVEVDDGGNINFCVFLSLSFNIDEFLGKRCLKPYTNMVKIVSVVGHKPTSIFVRVL